MVDKTLHKTNVGSSIVGRFALCVIKINNKGRLSSRISTESVRGKYFYWNEESEVAVSSCYKNSQAKAVTYRLFKVISCVSRRVEGKITLLNQTRAAYA